MEGPIGRDDEPWCGDGAQVHAAHRQSICCKRVTGRIFDARNVKRPECIERMAQDKPACFSSTATWTMYLDEVYRGSLQDSAARRALERGVTPDYCADCNSAFRTRMYVEGRCAPPAGAASLLPPLVGADPASAGDSFCFEWMDDAAPA